MYALGHLCCPRRKEACCRNLEVWQVQSSEGELGRSASPRCPPSQTTPQHCRGSGVLLPDLLRSELTVWLAKQWEDFQILPKSRSPQPTVPTQQAQVTSLHLC